MKKWNFLFGNEWEIEKGWIAVELFGFNIQKDYISFTIFGFSFTWEK